MATLDEATQTIPAVDAVEVTGWPPLIVRPYEDHYVVEIQWAEVGGRNETINSADMTEAKAAAVAALWAEFLTIE